MQQLLTGQKRFPEFRNRPWITSKLGDHVDLLTGYPFASSKFSDDGHLPRLLRGSNVKRGYLDWSEGITVHWKSDGQDYERFQLVDGDIIVALDGLVGTSLAKVCRSDLPAYLVQRVARLRAKKTLNQEYLWAALHGTEFRRYVERVKTQTAVAHISPDDLRNWLLPFPDLEEQARLGELFRHLSSEIDLLAAQREQVEMYKRGLLSRLLSGSLQIPA